jgi:pimeloyl-ACP methyl ester carboxylesterase
MRDVLVKAVNENYENQLRGLKVPAEFVWGDADSVVPVSEARMAVQLVPESLGSLTILEGVGHLTPLESPSALRAAVLRLGTV